jgi:DNA primase catalytic core
VNTFMPPSFTLKKYGEYPNVMSNLSFQEAAEQVKQHLNIIDTIGRFVSFKKRGRSHLGLCPFHNERTPSFNVSAEKGFFKCFGCGESGDAISFLMKIENKTYGDVIREVAEGELGLSIRYSNDSQEQARYTQKKEERERLHDVLRNAGQWFHGQLLLPEQASIQHYLQQRGTTEEAMKRFQLGYAPEGWDSLRPYLLSACPHLQDEESLLVRAGLAGERDNGNGYYDKFRQRLMIPIHDMRGNVVGFGGRALAEEQQPKYLNSSESLVYQKSELLYGLFQAKEAVRKHQRAIVMEGYFDVIATHMAGIPEAVATCGTALTDQHITLLKKSGVEILYLCFDSDKAGRNATLSAIERLETWVQRQALKIRVLRIPDGKDPDDYFKTHTAEEFEALMREAPDGLRFRFDCALEGILLHTSDGQLEAVHRLLPLLARVKHPIMRAQLLATYSERLRLSEEALKQDLARYEGKQPGATGLHSRQYDSKRKQYNKETGKYEVPIAPEDFSQLRQSLQHLQHPATIENELFTLGLAHEDLWKVMRTSLHAFKWQSRILGWLWQYTKLDDYTTVLQLRLPQLLEQAQAQNKHPLAEAIHRLMLGQEALKHQQDEGTLTPDMLLQMANECLAHWHRRYFSTELERRNKALRQMEQEEEAYPSNSLVDIDTEATVLHFDVLEAKGH